MDRQSGAATRTGHSWWPKHYMRNQKVSEKYLKPKVLTAISRLPTMTTPGPWFVFTAMTLIAVLYGASTTDFFEGARARIKTREGV